MKDGPAVLDKSCPLFKLPNLITETIITYSYRINPNKHPALINSQNNIFTIMDSNLFYWMLLLFDMGFILKGAY